MRFFGKAALASFAMCVASVSHAGFITIDGGPAGVSGAIASNNNFITQLASPSVNVTTYTTGVSLGTDAVGAVSFYYYGKEAGYSNDFYAAGGLYHSTGYGSYQDNFGSPLAIGSIEVGPGLLNFGFCAYNGSLVGCVNNAQNDGFSGYTWQSIAMNVSDSTAWLFWDDSGAGPDDNHDDMLIKAVFTPKAVPEPATGALIGFGLLAMGVARRRKHQAR